MSAIFGLFNIFALIYAFRSLQLSAVVWREWSQIRQPPLNRRKKHLAEQASFFITVPIGVLVHELGHAVAVWMFGGRVAEFGYRAFWGYVVPEGAFSPFEDWFISLAGTLGSLLFGMTLWLLFRRHKNLSLRYFGLRAFRFQVYFSLIYYPVFTLLGFIGDWRTIYGFDLTPLASGLTAPAHLGLLLLFWWGDRIGWFEMVGHESTAESEKFRQLAAAAAAAPFDARLQMEYLDALRRGGAGNQARRKLDDFLKRNPNSGDAYLQLAALQSDQKSQIPRRAIQNAEKALSLGLSNQVGLAAAHRLIGKYYLDLGDGDKAATHLSQALAQVASDGTRAQFRAQLHHWRSQAYRRQRQYTLAYQDVQQAIALAQSSGDDRLTAFYQGELEIIEQHAGRSLGTPLAGQRRNSGDKPGSD
jgi:tetratricopeptide (TPR) repeat protein